MQTLEHTSNADFNAVTYEIKGDKVPTYPQDAQVALELWQERPLLLPPSAQAKILSLFEESKLFPDAKKALRLLSARSVLMLKKKHEIDVTAIFKQWQGDLAEQIKIIVSDLAYQIKRTLPKISIWLQNIIKFKDSDSDLTVFLLARALLVSDHPRLTRIFIDKMLTLFSNNVLHRYAEIELKKGNVFYMPKKFEFEPPLTWEFTIEPETPPREIDLSRLYNSVLRTITNLIFPLDSYEKAINDLVRILNGHKIEESLTLVKAENLLQWDAQTVRDEKWLVKLLQLNLSIFKQSQLVLLVKDAFTWQLSFLMWSEALSLLRHKELSADDNLMMSHISFAVSNR